MGVFACAREECARKRILTPCRDVANQGRNFVPLAFRRITVPKGSPMRLTSRTAVTRDGRKISSTSIRQVEIDEKLPEKIKPAADIGSAHWIVAMTEPRCEARAIAGLERAGYPVFVPMVTKWRRKGYRQNKIAVPLFPRYIFVGLISGPQYPVSRCESVSCVLSDGSGPIVVPTGLVEALSRRMMAGGYDETLKSSLRFSKGDAVTIARGRFASIAGKVASIPAEDRVTVLVSLLGVDHRVEIDADQVRKSA